MKIAIFLEGQTELIFVREMILKVFDYNVTIDYVKRSHLKTYQKAKNATHSFRLIDCEGDENVLKLLLESEDKYWKLGFDKIMALQDMYTKAYKSAAKTKGIQKELNEKYIQIRQKTINKKALKPEKISFHFAIMEVESWILACPHIFSKIDARLNPNFIKDKLNFNLETIDPETAFFHPAKELKQILELIDLNYDKSESIVNKIVSNFSKDDYELLNTSEKCTSFSKFYTNLPKATIQ